MSELTTTYTNLLSDAIKETKYNHTPETEATPQVILGASDGVLLIGVLKKDGIYHFYPIQSETTENDSQAAMGGVTASQGGNTFVPYIVICIVIYLLFFNKK